jgi:hypothetical protein
MIEKADLNTREIVFDLPMSAQLLFIPGRHFSFPLERCRCGWALDGLEFCKQCGRRVPA